MIETKSTMETRWNLDNSYSRLPDSFYTHLKPTPVKAPKMVILNHPLASSLGLNINDLQSNEGVEIFAGNNLPEGSIPLAQAYAGHQFGSFTMLGDGRAILLGEQVTPLGDRYDIQLKGSGKTPYSRRGDGRASLGPMLREYIISEAMHALGIPTTRSLAVVTTGESIIRENEQTGAILTRVAASHIRVGTFQYISEWGSVEELRALSDYTIQRHYPEVQADENQYLSLLKQVIKRQAELITKWQLVGFIHGVMNTDNMAISGETIDFGPCAFMDTYNPATVFSSIDTHGRYAYGNQPSIAAWNLARFAETLLPLIDGNHNQAVKLAQDAVSDFHKLYYDKWLKGMRAKLGIFNAEPEDEILIKDLLTMMEKYHADYTNTFRAFTFNKIDEIVMFGTKEFTKWDEKWQARISRQRLKKDSFHQLKQKSNPSIIPRNHRVEEALEAAVEKGDLTVMERLLEVLSCPYTYSPEQDEYSTLPPASTEPYQTYCGT